MGYVKTALSMTTDDQGFGCIFMAATEVEAEDRNSSTSNE